MVDGADPEDEPQLILADPSLTEQNLQLITVASCFYLNHYIVITSLV